MMRALNICLIAALVLAAGDVYKIKFESTRQGQRLARLRADIRQEQIAIAALRAQWAKLDNPSRIEGLARRHLSLRPMEAQQYDRFDNLPQRPANPAPVEQSDPIGTMIAHPDVLDPSITTGSAGRARR
jgi:cell division protein FtsL